MFIRKFKISTNIKLIITIILVLICLGLTFYHHFIISTNVLFTHFFYIPIVLSSFWWGRKGLCVAIFLAFVLITSRLLSHIDVPILEDFIRASLLIMVAILTTILKEKLQNLETITSSLLEAIPIALFGIDKEHRIIYWNKACEILTGLSESEMIGTKKHMKICTEEKPTLADLIVDGVPNPEEVKSKEYPKAKWWKSTSVEGTYKGEGFFPHIGKEGRWLHITAAPLKDIHGQIIGAVETLEDVTNKKLMEIELYQAQKMASLGRLAGGIVHEFNNLLSVIQNNLEIALLYAKTENKLCSCLNRIQKAASQASELVHQLLIFIRKAPMEMEFFDLNETVKEITDMLKDILGKNIILELKLEEKVWKIKGNSKMIGQVIMNLVINARDAMPDGGKITITTENIFKEGEKYVCLSVKDTGIGMSEEVKNHIFDPFFTTKAPGKGTGLGLSLVYGIIKQHGGWIEVESTIGKGTTFKIYLPVIKKLLNNETPFN